MRYLSNQEKAFVEDPSVEASLKVRNKIWYFCICIFGTFLPFWLFYGHNESVLFWTICLHRYSFWQVGFKPEKELSKLYLQNPDFHPVSIFSGCNRTYNPEKMFGSLYKTRRAWWWREILLFWVQKTSISFEKIANLEAATDFNCPFEKVWFKKKYDIKYDYLLIKLFYFRFHFVNGRWIKSHKIVDFPNKMLDPTDYLAAIPQQTILRHKELVTLGKILKYLLNRSYPGI